MGGANIPAGQALGHVWGYGVGIDLTRRDPQLQAREQGRPWDPFCFGPAPGLADICLVPQLGHARRFGANVGGYPRLLAAETACMALPALAGAVPGRQDDAE